MLLEHVLEKRTSNAASSILMSHTQSKKIKYLERETERERERVTASSLLLLS